MPERTAVQWRVKNNGAVAVVIGDIGYAQPFLSSESAGIGVLPGKAGRRVLAYSTEPDATAGRFNLAAHDFSCCKKPDNERYQYISPLIFYDRTVISREERETLLRAMLNDPFYRGEYVLDGRRGPRFELARPFYYTPGDVVRRRPAFDREVPARIAGYYSPTDVLELQLTDTCEIVAIVLNHDVVADLCRDVGCDEDMLIGVQANVLFDDLKLKGPCAITPR